MKNHIRPLIFALSVMAFTAHVRGRAEPQSSELSLNAFLETVKSQHEGYQASEKSRSGAALYAGESQLIYRPSIFGTFEYADDGRPSPMPYFQYESIVRKTYSLGVSQLVPGGLQAKLYYTLGGTTYHGQAINYDEGRPTLELTASLWRNFAGREIDAQVDALKAGHRARELSESFLLSTYLLKAESAYWRLALARQTEGLARENLLRAERLFQWAERRTKLSLSDRSDLLQVTTVLQARRLELRQAEDELRSASLGFNSARGVESDVVNEKLSSITKELLDALKVPERKGDRADVLAAQEQAKGLRAQATLNREKSKGTFELYGAYAFNSKEDNMGDAFDKSFDGKRPSKVVGLRFSTSLAPFVAGDVRSGWEQEALAADLNSRRKVFEQEQDWKDVSRRFQEAKLRLEAAEELEKAQRQKLDYERDRHLRGRTTLFQVLTFESDYLQAQGIHIRTLAELLQIAAQMKLYGVNNESR